MNFRYEGFTAKNEVKRGYVEAESEGSAAEKLREMGIFLNKLEPDSQTPMKTALPGGTPLEMRNPDSPSSLTPKVEEQPKTVLMPKADWRKEFKANVKLIRSVTSELEIAGAFDVEGGGFEKRLTREALDAATIELLKSAVLKAVKTAML